MMLRRMPRRQIYWIATTGVLLVLIGVAVWLLVSQHRRESERVLTGRLVDQYGTPVVAAEVSVVLTDWGTAMARLDEPSTTRIRVLTDNEGRFEVRGQFDTARLEVSTIPGYLLPPPSPFRRMFSFSGKSSDIGSPELPFELSLWRLVPSVPLIRESIMYESKAGDDEVDLSFRDAAVKPADAEGHANIRFNVIPGRSASSLVVTTNDLGLAEAVGPFPFEAPQEMKQSNLTFPRQMGYDLSYERFATSFFHKDKDGNYSYASIEVTSRNLRITSMKGVYVRNLSGSRNLQFDPLKRISLPQKDDD